MRILARTNWLVAVSLLALLCLPQESHAKVFTDCGGILAAEIESAPLTGDWVLETNVGGEVGNFYRWNGPNLFGQPGFGILTFELEINQAGTYEFDIRNFHDHEDSTEANDVWVRLDGGPWVKVFSSVKDFWVWHSNHEFSHHNKPPAQYELSAGPHTLEFSGRSHDFYIDRFHLYIAGHPNGNNQFIPETLFPCDDGGSDPGPDDPGPSDPGDDDTDPDDQDPDPNGSDATPASGGGAPTGPTGVSGNDDGTTGSDDSTDKDGSETTNEDAITAGVGEPEETQDTNSNITGAAVDGEGCGVLQASSKTKDASATPLLFASLLLLMVLRRRLGRKLDALRSS